MTFFYAIEGKTGSGDHVSLVYEHYIEVSEEKGGGLESLCSEYPSFTKEQGQQILDILNNVDQSDDSEPISPEDKITWEMNPA